MASPRFVLLNKYVIIFTDRGDHKILYDPAQSASATIKFHGDSKISHFSWFIEPFSVSQATLINTDENDFIDSQDHC